MTDSNSLRGALTGGAPVQPSPADPAQAQLPPVEGAQQPAPVISETPAPSAAPVSTDPGTMPLPATQPIQPQQPSAIDELEALISQQQNNAAQTLPAPPTMVNNATVQADFAPYSQPQPAVSGSDPTVIPAAIQPEPQAQQPQFDPTQQIAAPQLELQESLQLDPTAQAVLSNIQQTSTTLNPANPAPASAKETFERPAAPDASSIDAGGAVQQVEVERNPELPVEVEGFLQRVEDFSAKQVQEVVIADGTNEQAAVTYPSRPVIILPITQEEEQKNKRKSPRNSIRWLIEWSHKVIKMFAGKVLYKTEETK